MGIQEPRPDLPDVVVGLGGAGRSVARALLDREWVVESIAAAPAGEGRPECYLVDADTERPRDDADIAAELNDRIREAIHSEDGAVPGGDVVSVLNLAEPVENEVPDPQALVTERMAERIVRETGTEAWWLTGDEPAPPFEGFHHGTMRRRALAKALAPAAQALDCRDPLDQVVPEVAGTDAVLVAGLGGGLGSGLALDLARRMEAAGTNVTLFGILPGGGFGDMESERTNAHATLSELEYLAVTDENPFENVVLVPTPDDSLDIEAYDEAIAHAVLAHSNLPANDRAMLDETRPAGPDRYAPFTVALPQVLRFERETVDRALAETVDWLRARQDRLDVELDLYGELADLVAEAFPEARGPVVAHVGDEPASPEEAPADPIDDPDGLPVEEAQHLLWRVDALLETLGGDLFETLDADAAFDWLRAIQQVREDARATAGDDDPRAELTHLMAPLRDILLNDPVQGEPIDFQVEETLHETVRMELKAVVFRSRILRAAYRMDDAVYREGVLGAVDADQRVARRDLRVRVDELGGQLQEQRERTEAIETIRDEVEERSDHRIAEFRADARSAVETLVLTARHRSRLEELLDDIEDRIRALVARVEDAEREAELPEDPLDPDLLDELDALFVELEIDSIDRRRLRESARGVVEAKAAWLDWQGHYLPFFSDWPDAYLGAFERVDPELFDIPTADEAEREFYCRFVGGHILERPRETVEARRDRAVDDVVRAAEFAAETTDLDVNEFRVSAADRPDIEWSGIDDSWRAELRDALRSVPGSHDPPSAEQVLGELCGPEGIVREAVEEALLSPVDRALDDARDDFEATESDLDRAERLEGIVEAQGQEFATRAGGSQFPGPGTDLGSSTRADRYVQRVANPIDHLLQHESLAETDHPDVRATVEEFLDATVAPFDHLDDRVGLAAGDVVGRGNAGPVPYDGHRVVRAHFGTVFSDGGDVPTDDALGEVADAVGANGNVASRHFGFGDPWEVTAVTLVGGVFLDNLAPVTGADSYRSAYGRLRDDLGDQIRLHHAHGLDGRDRSLVGSGDDAGFVYRDRVLDVHDGAAMGPIVAAAEDEAVEWLLEECVATESFTGSPDSNPDDDAGGPDRS